MKLRKPKTLPRTRKAVLSAVLKPRCPVKLSVLRHAGDAEMLFSVDQMASCLQEMNSGTTKLCMIQLNTELTMHRFMERMRIDGPTKLGFQAFRRGTYGAVYVLRTNTPRQFVLKVSDYYDDDMFSGPFVESFLLRYLFRQFVLTGLTPHLPLALSSAYSRARKEVITLTEYAHYGSLHDFFAHLMHSDKGVNIVVRIILFQIAYTLAWLHYIHPNFRHNDAKSTNIVLAHAPTSGYTEYRTPDGKVFHVPNIGVRAILLDFDMASIVGVADNARANMFEIENPEFGIASEQHFGFDLYQVVYWLSGLCMKSTCFLNGDVLREICILWRQWDLAIPTHETSPAVRLPEKQEHLPTPLEVLSSSMFTSFHADERQKHITDVFGSRSLKVPFLTTDEIVDMLFVDPKYLTGTYTYKVPLGFGAPEDVCRLLLSLPAARVYERLVNLENITPSATVGIGEWEWSYAQCGQLVNDLLVSKAFPTDQIETKIQRVLHGFYRVMFFLRTIEKRFFKLLLLVALFQEGQNVSTDNFSVDVNGYAGGCYDIETIYITLMQYKWIKLILTERK